MTKEVLKFEHEALVEIEDQPFQLYSSEKMQELADDIMLDGQISPLDSLTQTYRNRLFMTAYYRNIKSIVSAYSA